MAGRRITETTATPAATPAANNTFEKAAAFLNLSVMVKGGDAKQIGGIPLHLSKALHKALIELGPEGVSKLTFTVSMNLVEAENKPFEFL